MPMNKDKDRYLLSSVNNTLGLLDVLAQHEALSLAELSRITGHDKTSLFRMMYTLEKNGFVTKDADARYSLGLKLVALGGSVVTRRSVIDVARPHLARLARETGMSAHMGQLAGTRVVTVAVENPGRGLQVTGRVGMSARAHSTAMGRALLAGLSEEEYLHLRAGFKYIAYTERSVASDEELDRLLAGVRKDGYATDINDRYAGFGGLAAPVFDISGHCIAAAGVVGLAQGIEEQRDELASAVLAATAAISAELGHTA